jgi:hypothetical protein
MSLFHWPNVWIGGMKFNSIVLDLRKIKRREIIWYLFVPFYSLIILFYFLSNLVGVR